MGQSPAKITLFLPVLGGEAAQNRQKEDLSGAEGPQTPLRTQYPE